MLSICIPVYNYDLRPLITELINQARVIDLNIEIIVYDDGSDQSFKNLFAELKTINEVRYYEAAENIGCAATRNQMAVWAKFSNILFIDSDSALPKNYLKKYQPLLKSDILITYGGRVHPIKLPSADKSLRWKVGKKREDFNAEQRRIIPNKSFMSNNFLAKKELFDKVSFNASIKRSGHEDTMFGIELEEKGICINHIDNAVTHIGLESNDEFILKNRNRLETLKLIMSVKQNNKLVKKRIKIIKYYELSKLAGLLPIIRFAYRKTNKAIEKSMHSKSPNLWLFDFYKLGYYSTL
ncbi:glycosyltransferase family 2 protein [Carboxylicivirga sp. N1Y90]|uniref:glycosyltransferase family 2 protein n=1 Tax=Carboxylicivirga fragile TaxID=3417571 RepID=UPI003D33C3C8|nr:glycosyltransferase [Marinilabiliaceae bacterium N1Y90]